MSIQSSGQPPDVTPWQMQQTMPPQRSSRDSKTALIVATVVIVVVVFFILAAVFAFWFLGQGLISAGGGGTSRALGFTLTSTGANWTLTVTAVSGNMRPSDIFMTIFDQNGVVKNPMSSIPLSDLTLVNWPTYKVMYQKLSAGGYIGVGDHILVYKTTYMSSYSYQIRDSSTILSIGVFH